MHITNGILRTWSRCQLEVGEGFDGTAAYMLPPDIDSQHANIFKRCSDPRRYTASNCCEQYRSVGRTPGYPRFRGPDGTAVQLPELDTE